MVQIDLSFQQRHDTSALKALHLLKTLSEQATKLPSIVSSLSSFNWINNGTIKGVRMFILPSEGEINGDNTIMRRGVRSNESLYLRGEGFLEGSWKTDDVVATIRSFGARVVWDARFDGMTSYEVSQLSKDSRLVYLKMKGTPPVSDTDICIVSNYTKDEITGFDYILSTSVVDDLVPDVLGFRTIINLQGFCLRPCLEAPDFEIPVTAPILTEGSKFPIRPSHRRNQSSLSIGLFPTSNSSNNISGQSSMRSVSNSSKNPNGNGGGGGDFLVVPIPPIKGAKTFPLYTLKNQVNSSTDSKKPGIHISLITHVKPSINLPASYASELANKIPLSISSLNKYLSTYGFAPYIIRRTPRIELDILEETFDVNEMKYRVVFRVHEGIKSEETLIRFFGGGFTQGRFDIEITRARGWRLEFDILPEREPEMNWCESLGKSDGSNKIGKEDEWSKAASRKTTLSVSNNSITSTSPITRQDYFQRSYSNPVPTTTTATTPTATSPISTTIPSTPYQDPALRSGPLGACTIHIPNHSIASGPPITLIITKSTTSSKSSHEAFINKLESTSHTLARASKNILNLNGTRGEGEGEVETIEELLNSGTKEGKAKMSLKGTREVLRLLREGRLEEERNASPNGNGKGSELERFKREMGQV